MIKFETQRQTYNYECFKLNRQPFSLIDLTICTYVFQIYVDKITRFNLNKLGLNVNSIN